MGLSVGELLDRFSSYELAEWMAYYQIEPWGQERADLRAGVVASTVANMFRKEGAKALQPSDFLLDFDRPAKGRPGWQDIKSALMGALRG